MRLIKYFKNFKSYVKRTIPSKCAICIFLIYQSRKFISSFSCMKFIKYMINFAIVKYKKKISITLLKFISHQQKTFHEGFLPKWILLLLLLYNIVIHATSIIANHFVTAVLKNSFPFLNPYKRTIYSSYIFYTMRVYFLLIQIKK